VNYKTIVKGEFIERPNRFIGIVRIQGQIEQCHIKNTGRCKELLLPGVVVYLESHNNEKRKTKYSLIAVEKGTRLINMDSQAPNKVVYEALMNKKIVPNSILIKPEQVFGHSRIDFYVETASEKIMIEVKGVTLETDGMTLFPDAPTQRGVKHIEMLCDWVKDGNKAILLFVVQMSGVDGFTPNKETHPEFVEALLVAKEIGVQILAYDCIVSGTSLVMNEEVPIFLEGFMKKN